MKDTTINNRDKFIEHVNKHGQLLTLFDRIKLVLLSLFFPKRYTKVSEESFFISFNREEYGNWVGFYQGRMELLLPPSISGESIGIYKVDRGINDYVQDWALVDKKAEDAAIEHFQTMNV